MKNKNRHVLVAADIGRHHLMMVSCRCSSHLSSAAGRPPGVVGITSHGRRSICRSCGATDAKPQHQHLYGATVDLLPPGFAMPAAPVVWGGGPQIPSARWEPVRPISGWLVAVCPGCGALSARWSRPNGVVDGTTWRVRQCSGCQARIRVPYLVHTGAILSSYPGRRHVADG